MPSASNNIQTFLDNLTRVRGRLARHFGTYQGTMYYASDLYDTDLLELSGFPAHAMSMGRAFMDNTSRYNESTIVLVNSTFTYNAGHQAYVCTYEGMSVPFEPFDLYNIHEDTVHTTFQIRTMTSQTPQPQLDHLRLPTSHVHVLSLSC